jgi:hypothetical protein
VTPSLQAVPAARGWLAAAGVVLALGATPAAAVETIVFIGNSFTYAQGSAVQTYRPNTVTDLNGTNIGGIPALFKSFTAQAGLDYAVSLETVGGSGLDLHYNTKRSLLDRPWDHVVMHTFSTLDSARPGNPATLLQYSALFVGLFERQNPNVDINLMATWSRADQTYPRTGAWFGQDIYAMSRDVRAGYDLAAATVPGIDGVIPVGAAWDLAWRTGYADPNPYDGITAGQRNLWATDNYHASLYGSYLEALTVFGSVTGLDPLVLGANEQAARDLGIAPTDVLRMQQLASTTLQVAAIPEPETYALMALGLGAIGLVARRRRQTAPAAEPALA